MPMRCAVRRSRIGPETPREASHIIAIKRPRFSRRLRKSHVTSTTNQNAAEEQVGRLAGEPGRGGEHEGRAGIELAAEITEHRLELRHHIEQEEEQDQHLRRADKNSG